MAITISGNGITSANISDGTITNADINASAAIDGSKISGDFGKVLQVVSVTKTDTASHSSDTWTDISGMTVNITPSSTNSKILIMVSTTISGSGGAQFIRLNRVITGGDVLTPPTSPGSRSGVFIASENNGHGNGAETYANHFFDSPNTTSQCTYKLQWRWQGGTIYLNRSRDDTDNASFPRGVSSITVMEIGA